MTWNWKWLLYIKWDLVPTQRKKKKRRTWYLVPLTGNVLLDVNGCTVSSKWVCWMSRKLYYFPRIIPRPMYGIDYDETFSVVAKIYLYAYWYPLPPTFIGLCIYWCNMLWVVPLYCTLLEECITLFPRSLEFPKWWGVPSVSHFQKHSLFLITNSYICGI